jgi:hypothetical protein
MIPHPVFTAAAGLLLAAAWAMLDDRSPRERLYVGIRILFCCVATVVGGSWLMRLIHG